MPDKVPPPTCIRCGNNTLTGKSRSTTMQIEDSGSSRTENVTYVICHKCIDAHGTIVRIWRRPGEKDVAYFLKDERQGVELEPGTI